jgi:hypothetical protein
MLAPVQIMSSGFPVKLRSSFAQIFFLVECGKLESGL